MANPRQHVSHREARDHTSRVRCRSNAGDAGVPAARRYRLPPTIERLSSRELDVLRLLRLQSLAPRRPTASLSCRAEAWRRDGMSRVASWPSNPPTAFGGEAPSSSGSVERLKGVVLAVLRIFTAVAGIISAGPRVGKTGTDGLMEAAVKVRVLTRTLFLRVHPIGCYAVRTICSSETGVKYIARPHSMPHY